MTPQEKKRGRPKKSKELTQEQFDWRNSILRGKIRSINKLETHSKSVLSDEEKLRQCFFYLNNCVFWINEYLDGKVNKARLLETVKAIEQHARNIQLLLKYNSNK